MSQLAFQKALLDPDLPVPDGLTDAEGRPAGRRFSVYRNNVAGSLTENLEKGFPVLQKLLGAEYFSALAGIFIREHPPKTRVMMLYGADMPGFLKHFPPLAHLPYLADVARLEQALREAYHAADVAPIAPDVLAALAPEAFMAAGMRLAPAVRVIASDYPVWSIWRANTESGAPPPVMRAEAAIVMRPDFDPAPHLLPPGAKTFLAAVMAGQSIGAGLEACDEDFDFAQTLTLLLQGGAVTDLPKDT